MKIRKRLKWKCVLALAVLLTLPCLGLMQTRAAKGIDLNRECSLTVSVEIGSDAGGNDAYLEDFNKMEIPVSVYLVANVDATGQRFTPQAAFQEMNFDKINGSPDKVTADDWRTLAGQAEKLRGEFGAEASGTAVVRMEEGNEAASGKITGLKPGLYLVAADAVYNPDYTTEYQFTPYLTALPGSEYTQEGTGSDEWVYDTVIGLKADAVPQYGKLNITKILKEFNETLGRTTFVFHIVGVDRYGATQYEEVESMTFTAAGSNTITLEHIPAGLTVTVTEIYSGASYVVEGKDSDTALIWSGAAVSAGVSGEASVTFTNRYDGGNRGGYGVTNRFESDGNGGWTWENPTALAGE